MEQLPNYKHKIDFLMSNNTQSIQQEQTITKSKYKKKKCNECNKRRKTIDESHQICHVCYKHKAAATSGNKVIDDFIRYTQINFVKREGKMEFVPYDQFKDVEFIAEGGFSKIYKATWVDGPIDRDRSYYVRQPNYSVALKKLNNSKNITSKELNELKVFYNVSTKRVIRRNNYQKEWRKPTLSRKYQECDGYSNRVSKYFGITQDPITEEIMIIMPYYHSGDLIHYITNNFYDFDWYKKLENLLFIIIGLNQIHIVNIVHRDLHSGNIFINDFAIIGDLGISKSATESTDDNNENYGIIPYMAPEVFHGHKYTAASDIYSFGMIMWELMTGRRPFWDRNHDTDLIIEICDGLRPPIVTNAPEWYIELMKECWHSDPNKRPTGDVIYEKIKKIYMNEFNNAKAQNPTKISIESPDIGPVTTNNPGAFYKSRPLSGMIQSAMSSRSSRNQSIDQSYYWKNNTASTDKRKPVDNLIEDKNYNDQNVKRRKLLTNKNSEYLTKEMEFDINVNVKSNQTHNNDTEYVTKEICFDI